MSTATADVMDPMYNFDTHFPERMSKVHVHGDTFVPPSSQGFRKTTKKSRANRLNGARYKTQPVTFSEITEVDEEPATPAPHTTDAAGGKAGLVGQLQAFSKSLDGLMAPPKLGLSPLDSARLLQPGAGLSRSHSFHRTGSRKLRHPDCIPEKAEPRSPVATAADPSTNLSNPNLSPNLAPYLSPNKVPSLSTNNNLISAQPSLSDSSKGDCHSANPRVNLPGGDTSSSSPSSKRSSESAGAAQAQQGVSPTSSLKIETEETSASTSPIPSPGLPGRRQKMTAKAKKRQKAQAES